MSMDAPPNAVRIKILDPFRNVIELFGSSVEDIAAYLPAVRKNFGRDTFSLVFAILRLRNVEKTEVFFILYNNSFLLFLIMFVFFCGVIRLTDL